MTGQITLAEFRTFVAVDTGINLSQSMATDFIRMIRSEYLEMPGLHLTKPQVRRLWNLDEVACDALLDALVTGQFLRRTATGAYVRADGGGQ